MEGKKGIISALLTGAVVLSVPCFRGYCEGGRPAFTSIPFEDPASGGTLILASSFARNADGRCVTIETSPGQSPESVVESLAAAIAMSDSLYRLDRLPHVDRDSVRRSMASGRTLQKLAGRPGDYYLAGTETGLGIPQAPRFLSCSYDELKDRVVLNWENPPDGYDMIAIHLGWSNDHHRGGDVIAGTETTFVIDRGKTPVNTDDLDILLVGLCGGVKSRKVIPSNATAVHVTAKGHCQEETYGIPFSAGIAPNWVAWSTSTEPGPSALEQGGKHTGLAQFYNPARSLSTKPYYQIIRAPSNGVVHGVHRKFLGLTPGHTYRLTACLTTLGMDSAEGDWSLSLCAAHNGPGGADLTVQQLAGLATLPDGSTGPEAGRIAFYERGKTTKGDHKLVFSDNPSEGGPENMNITLPGGAETITVWVRFKCSDPNGKVGFSGVKLEDITANPEPKPWQQIERAEYMEEAALLRREQRALQRSVR